MTPPAAMPSLALAHHWLVNMRGGEKVLAALGTIFPAAPIYTLLSRPECLSPELRDRTIYTSWLQRFASVPGAQRWNMPWLGAAARSLDATAHDVVVCSDAATIKAIRTRPDALKICYCHSPMRYVWDQYDEYYAQSGLAGRVALRLFASRLRREDQCAAETVTAFIANSRHVAQRIRRCYDRSSVVIYPPVDTAFPPPLEQPDDFYLVVGEHVAYKRNDLAVEACNHLRRNLVVIGAGPGLKAIRKLAGPTVQVLGWQDDTSVRDHLRRCRALLFCGQEDFGIVPVEAQAAGRPVIAYAAGGVLETIVENKTGHFFREQTPESLVVAIERFENSGLHAAPPAIQLHAQQFSRQHFRDEFERFYTWCLELHRAGGPHRVRAAVEESGPAE